MNRRSFLISSALAAPGAVVAALSAQVAPATAAIRVQTREPNDPDWHHPEDGRSHGRIVIFDGVKLEDCKECNAREGWAVAFARDDRGKFFIHGGKVATKTLWGAVRILYT